MVLWVSKQGGCLMWGSVDVLGTVWGRPGQGRVVPLLGGVLPLGCGVWVNVAVRKV